MNVFGYVRVSTEGQTENYSIDEQIQSIKAYCKAKKWNLIKTYTDGGHSGGNVNRPALQEMLREIRNKTVDAVVVYKLDRLSRSQKDTLMLIEDEFLIHQTDFVSINENFDTSSPFGRAMIGMLSVFAQLEKDQITERFTMGRIGRSKAGYFHGGGNSPLGYRYENGLLIIDPYQADIVREIFDRFISGQSINYILTQLQGRHSGKWSATKISTVLRNSVYIGKVKFKGVEYDGIHQPIISEETFRAANQLFSSPERTGRFTTAQKTPFRATTLLSGIVFCRRCGARYSSNHGYYRCYSRAKSSKRFIKDPNCKNENWLIEDLNHAVVEHVRAMTNNPDLIADAIRQSHSVQPEKNLEELHQRIEEIGRQINKLVDLYQFGTIPPDILTKRVEALSQEKEALQNKLNEQDQTANDTAIQSFLDAIQTFNEQFDTGDLDAQRLIISSLIDRIEVDGFGIEIAWRV